MYYWMLKQSLMSISVTTCFLNIHELSGMESQLIPRPLIAVSIGYSN